VGKKYPVVELLKEKSDKLLALIPKGALDPAVAIPKLIMYINEHQELLEAVPETLYVATAHLFALGLVPGDGKCCIIKYGPKAQEQLMWQGLVELMMRHPAVKKVDTQVIHENDDYDINLLNPQASYIKPNMKNRGAVVAFYAQVVLEGGEIIPEFMLQDEVNEHRDKYSKDYKRWVKGGKKGTCVWIDSPIEMGRKTPLIKLSKRVPKTAEVEAAIRRDNEVTTSFDDAVPIDVDVVEPGDDSMADAKSALKAQADKKRKEKAAVPPAEPDESPIKEGEKIEAFPGDELKSFD